MNKKYLGEAYIMPDGVYLTRQFHLWRGWGARLEDVSFSEDEKFLAFQYSTPNVNGRSDYTLCLPVPAGKKQETRQSWRVFKKRATSD